ncbi:hypothetical protein EHV15_12675 [Paenibacillus oralis]|uniref:DUF2281 domain-containing protein n=1 Tax=Paenibacillus oralis TaxID=2490856 RepID=A0A3P3U229_9BACL|nr:hypothetical protein [Paenibacillus oralis]RRJ63689.1 hypothetical protein EHV15_12675 [Paenibacillus oralis]
MGVNREELKRLIDQMPEQDALQVYDFIGFLSLKREKDNQHQLDISFLEEDSDLIRQVQHSLEDRKHGRLYGKESGLEYLRAKVKDFEHGQNI